MHKKRTYTWHGIMVGIAMTGAMATWLAFSVVPEMMQAQQKSSASGRVQTTPTTTSSSSTTGTTEDGVNDFESCNEDAHTYCSGLYGDDWQTWAATNGYVTASWKLALVDCLGKNIELTTDACDAALLRRADLNAYVNEMCATERGTLCRGVKPVPGSEAGNDCLKAHYSELSATCAAALDAQQAAKPTE